jgi:hemoglobin
LRAATFLAIVGMTTHALAMPRTLYEAMGGERTLRLAVDRFTDVVEADSRINFTFAEADLNRFKELLYEQLCQLSDGPCEYTGRDMRTAHAKLAITTAQFDALAEDLYIGLSRAGVPYRLQNKLMARLAPMKRDIVKAGPKDAP